MTYHRGMARRVGKLTAPFVVTLAANAASCAKPVIGPPIPVDADTGRTALVEDAASKAPTNLSDDTLVHDGYGSCYRIGPKGDKVYAPQCPESILPEPPKDRLVFRHGPYCQRVPDGRAVKCPANGPTAIVPKTNTSASDPFVYLQYGTLECFRGHDVRCPEGVSCNPPPPRPVPCPLELMPSLAKGVEPTKQEGAQCWFGTVKVVCPKP